MVLVIGRSPRAIREGRIVCNAQFPDKRRGKRMKGPVLKDQHQKDSIRIRERERQREMEGGKSLTKKLNTSQNGRR